MEHDRPRRYRRAPRRGDAEAPAAPRRGDAWADDRATADRVEPSAEDDRGWSAAPAPRRSRRRAAEEPEDTVDVAARVRAARRAERAERAYTEQADHGGAARDAYDDGYAGDDIDPRRQQDYGHPAEVDEAEPGLVVSNVAKSFKRRPVVRDVSLTVRRGEIVGLLGPNGAGKTTCFYMITGLVPVDQGGISLRGQNLTDLPMYRRARMGLGYLPQEASIFRGLSVEDNIRAALELVEPSRLKRERRLDQLLAEFSITRLRKTPAVALSGGERRRVEIARALATNPSFVLLDEPFAGVDPIAVGDIRSLVWQLKDRGIGVLITDHNVRETLEIIDRAYILHDGRVLMEGAPDEVIGDENVRRVYLGEGFRI